LPAQVSRPLRRAGPDTSRKEARPASDRASASTRSWLCSSSRPWPPPNAAGPASWGAG